MKILALALVALVGCGVGVSLPFTDIYEDDYALVEVWGFDRWESAPPDWVGYADFADNFRIFLREALLNDPDADKVVRVALHELLNVLALADGDETAHGAQFPAGIAPGWYLFDSDALDPDTPILPEEAAWIDAHTREYRVEVRDAWTRTAVEAAVGRIHAAIGRNNLFRVED